MYDPLADKLAGIRPLFKPKPKPLTLEEEAWEIYCETTKGCMSAVCFWNQLGPNTQEHYLSAARRKRQT